MSTLRVRLLSLSLVITLEAVGVVAQETAGALAGTIADEQGQVLPGAAVTASHERTHGVRTTVSDPRGSFQLPALPPGSYTVRVELQNFRTLERKNVVLSGGERLSLGTLRLTIGLGEAIVVEESGTKVNTDETQHAGLITSKQIEQIQTKGRDVTTLMRLAPGVRYEDTVDSLGESFGTLVPHVSGQRRTWNHITVDGVLGNEIGQTDRMAQQINLDAVGEIKILLNTYRAEYGRTGGAQIQIVSKGGDAQYRGNAYYYGRNERLNANNFFNNRSNRPRPRYRFNTFGFNLGGPIPGLNKDEKKLFFFYSIEAPLTERPGPLRQWMVPTELERRGDFSQTLDSAGRLIVIRDPLTGKAFPGNILPPGRINPNGLALLNLMPLPNSTDRNFTKGQFNYERQETADNPKLNNLLRLDWRPSPSDSLYLTIKDWWSDQRGSEITAGPNKWGWFNTHYLNTDRTYSVSHTHVFNSHLVNEAQVGARRQSESFQPVTEADWQRLRRADNGYTLGQFHPEVNLVGGLPKATFNVLGNANSPPNPNLTYENRLVGDGGVAWVHSFNDNLTWIKGRHTFKGGFYFEHLYNTEGKGSVGAGPWAGQFNFSADTANPFDTGYSFANALIGSFRDYTEIDALPEVKAHRYLAESYLQDTWKLSRRLTIDYGVRFLWFEPWYTNLPAATFVPALYDPAKAPRLYQPARINNQNVATDPVTGEVRPNPYVGSFVPGTGDPYNGMVSSTDPNYPKGFRDNQGIMPEPRLGLAWDIFGNGKTALHASAGLFHQAQTTARSMDQAANNPPAVNTPQIFYGTMDTLLAAGPSFSARPSSVNALERDAKTSSSYQWSIGFQREIGWGTVVDLTYVGWVARHMEQFSNVNVVPDGAKFVNLHPENANPQNPNTPKPDDFLRPYLGYGDITLRSNFGTANYNGLQVQINRRYIRGLQFAVAYTYGKALGIADEDETYAPSAGNQLHNLVINYTWDLPRASKLWNNGVIRLLFDDWQLSGENAFASGDWAPVLITTTDNFDFTGGTGGAGQDVGNGLRVVRPVIVGNVVPDNRNAAPDAPGSWLNAAAFARPARGEYGNEARYIFRMPGINNWNLSFFKNFPLGSSGRRRLQLRWEMYNVLNHTQFGAAYGATGYPGIDNTLRFDATGKQVNANFGKATAARNPTF
ncbi:MAG: hypothetical protein DMF79_03860 [Acidobacteria bacterium]|nr:MAG: hypothetical protein DMF79_03860 [Acidobacteriota bacterium]